MANADVAVHLHSQSSDIAQGVDSAGNKDEGAGDQGIMFGYACRETDDADAGAAVITRTRSCGPSATCGRPATISVAGLLPDAKSQVTLRYVDGKPVGATSVVVSTQHEDGMEQAEIKRLLWPLVESHPAERLDVRRRRVPREPDRQVRASAARMAIAA